ncbi:acrosin-like [Gavia stellata]|uniref:acrosin-like n=1 Tax=Gavia stellata TaxID=37040 RepID=UPI002898CCD0|nr:acrosin-like [Gavia stellata]
MVGIRCRDVARGDRATRLPQLGPEAQVRTIKRLLVHEHYSNITQRNDIALLELDQPVQCSYSIQLACVPDASLRVSELTACYASGWGSTTARSGGSTDVLQEAKVCLIDVNLCNSSGWYRGAIHTHNLCAGYAQGGIDTCQVGACYESSPSSTGSPLATTLHIPQRVLCLASHPPTAGSPPLLGLTSPSPPAAPCPVPPLPQRPATLPTKPIQCSWQHAAPHPNNNADYLWLVRITSWEKGCSREWQREAPAPIMSFETVILQANAL